MIYYFFFITLLKTDAYETNENEGIKSSVFLSKQVVWAKRALNPWLPAIVRFYFIKKLFLF